jgi:catechol-2,3-dioxygenase
MLAGICPKLPQDAGPIRKPERSVNCSNLKGAYDMAPPKKLAHVVYMTRRYDEMISWYQNVFEAKVQYQNPAFAFLTYDDEHHRFAFANMSALNPTGTDIDSTRELASTTLAILIRLSANSSIPMTG